ncbi:MAG: DUF2993 domain-containing protein [Actinomycetota bacterium]
MAPSIDSPQSGNGLSNANQGTTNGQSSEGFESRQGSRIISTVLSPAVQLWLRAQVQQVEALAVKIEGSDRQLLQGIIPQVSLTAHSAVYQGLHLSDIALTATNIRVNLGQVIKGKPLRLLAPIPVVGEVRLNQADLNQSLHAPLLATALSEFLLPLLPNLSASQQQIQLQNPQIKIDACQLTLTAAILPSNGKQLPFFLKTGLRLASSHELLFEEPDVQISQESTRTKLESFKLDLGPEVKLQELTLIPGEIVCRGGIQVNP